MHHFGIQKRKTALEYPVTSVVIVTSSQSNLNESLGVELSASEKFELDTYNSIIQKTLKQIKVFEEGILEERDVLALYYRVRDDLHHAIKYMQTAHNAVSIFEFRSVVADLDRTEKTIKYTRQAIGSLKKLLKDHQSLVIDTESRIANLIKEAKQRGKVLNFDRKQPK